MTSPSASASPAFSGSPCSPAPLAVVTGASRGIGREIALTLARAGWDVAFSHLDDETGARAVAADLAKTGRNTLARRCDAGVKAEVWEFYRVVVETFGRVPTLLVNNAGVQTIASLLDLAEEDWETASSAPISRAASSIPNAWRSCWSRPANAAW